MVVTGYMAFELGQLAGPYEFVAVEENSRTGCAYKVRNTMADRFELLRILPSELQENREEQERFLREIKVHARLSHPNIVSFHTATELGGQAVMISEYFEGTTLEKRLEAGAMQEKEAIACMSQVLSALSYAHEHGVVHREVSPPNIVLGPDGAVKLTGFGLAKSASDPQLTCAGTVMGWLEYMSPEQVKGLDSLDSRTDIYSAGAVLFEMVTGQIPFVRENQFDLMMAHVNAPPPSPLGLKPDLSLELSHIIITALSKDPAERFQTAAKFREALGRIGAAQPPELLPLVPETEPAAEGWASRSLLLTGVFTFLVVVAAFLALLKIARP
jgi:serine/threonine protein kinase